MDSNKVSKRRAAGESALRAISELYDSQQGLCNSQVTDSQAIEGLTEDDRESSPLPQAQPRDDIPWPFSPFMSDTPLADASPDAETVPMGTILGSASVKTMSTGTSRSDRSELKGEDVEAGWRPVRADTIGCDLAVAADISASTSPARDADCRLAHCSCFSAIVQRLVRLENEYSRVSTLLDVIKMRDAEITGLALIPSHGSTTTSGNFAPTQLSSSETIVDLEATTDASVGGHTPSRKRRRTSSPEGTYESYHLTSPVPTPHIRSLDSQIWSTIMQGYEE